MDKVYIKDLKVETIIGIFELEREVKQIISVDIEMDFDNKKAARSDDIKDALDYKKVGKRVQILFCSNRLLNVVCVFCLTTFRSGDNLLYSI